MRYHVAKCDKCRENGQGGPNIPNRLNMLALAYLKKKVIMPFTEETSGAQNAEEGQTRIPFEDDEFK